MEEESTATASRHRRPLVARCHGQEKVDRCTIFLQLIHWGIVLPGLTILLLAMLVRLALNPEPKWAPTKASENATTPSGNATTQWENATIAHIERTMKFAIGVVSCLGFLRGLQGIPVRRQGCSQRILDGKQSVMLLQNVPELQAATAARFQLPE
ncbi:hypothetical protein MTO96_046135 [Rhipicephalus appendiculatus]